MVTDFFYSYDFVFAYLRLAEADKSDETGGGLVAGWLGFRIHRQLQFMLELFNFWMCKDDLYILFCVGVAENTGGS